MPEIVEEQLLIGMCQQLDSVISDGCSWVGCHRRSATLAALAGITEENGVEVTFHRVYVGFCPRHQPTMLDWTGLVDCVKPEGTGIVGTSVIHMPVAAWKELSAEVDNVH